MRVASRSYVLRKSDFGFSDVDGDTFQSVIFTTVPSVGTLYYDANGPLSWRTASWSRAR